MTAFSVMCAAFDQWMLTLPVAIQLIVIAVSVAILPLGMIVIVFLPILACQLVRRVRIPSRTALAAYMDDWFNPIKNADLHRARCELSCLYYERSRHTLPARYPDGEYNGPRSYGV